MTGKPTQSSVDRVIAALQWKRADVHRRINELRVEQAKLLVSVINGDEIASLLDRALDRPA